MRTMIVLACLWALTGCSTFRPEPPVGLMWAYLGDSQSVPTLRVLVYTLDRPLCEASRAKDTNPLALGSMGRDKSSG